MTATNITLDIATTPRASRRPALFWGALIVGLLSLEIGLCIWGVYCAVGGNQVVVESDYYNKALHWDDQMALEQASKRLGWNTNLGIAAIGTGKAAIPVTFQFSDSSGKAIDHADVTIGYFHHAHPMDVHEATLKEMQPGVYVAGMSLDKRGIWEFRISATRNNDRFVQIIQRDLEE